MSTPDRREMLGRADKTLSIRKRCALLSVARSVYRARKPPHNNGAALMRRIDELFTSLWPGDRRKKGAAAR